VTLWGRGPGEGSRQCHQITHGAEGEGQPKYHVTFFVHFKSNFQFLAIDSLEKLVFWKIKNVTSRGGVGV